MKITGMLILVVVVFALAFVQSTPFAEAGAPGCSVAHETGSFYPRTSTLGVEDTGGGPWQFPSVMPALSMRVRAIRLANDDGTEQANVNSTEMGSWIAKANAVFGSAGIHFDFNPSTDFLDYNSTLLNEISDPWSGDPDWSDRDTLARAIASSYPGEVVVYLRHGPYSSPLSNAFSGGGFDYVVMPGFSVTTVCGVQNIGLFAHELGHYFGLWHIFRDSYFSLSQAEAAFIAAGNDPALFDGDGLRDTRPDPFATEIQCSPPDEVVLGGVTFPLPVETRENIMSYYYPRSSITISQSWHARQAVVLRQDGDLCRLVSSSQDCVFFEAEFPLLNYQPEAGTNLTSANLYRSTGFCSGQTYKQWDNTAVGDQLTLFLYNTDEKYLVYAGFVARGDFSQVRYSLNNIVVANLDLYGGEILSFGIPTGPVRIGLLNESSQPTITAEVTGSNIQATGPPFGFGVDYYILIGGVLFADGFETGLTDQWSDSCPPGCPVDPPE